MATVRTVRAEARPFHAGAGDIGVVVSHGFTATVSSITPWATGLAEPDGRWPGARVIAPRLPGHGTHWRDLERSRWWDWYNTVEDAYLELSRECSHVFVAGLSMGGSLALRLSALHPVGGTLLVNPAVDTRDKRIALASRIPWLLPAQRGIGSDIARPGAQEVAYSRFPVRSLATMNDLWRDTRALLPHITSPVLLMTSSVDHVVDSLSRQVILDRVGDVEHVELERSYHVATLDHDADLIVQRSRNFISRQLGL